MSVSTGLNVDGNLMKQINKKKSVNYTSRDYESIKTELTNMISEFTEKWTSRDEADPGIVLIKLMSQFGDLLSYNLDKQILEMFPNSVTQRKNAQQLYNLVGYKMKWYISAKCVVNIINTYEQDCVIYPFAQFTTLNNQVTYTNVKEIDVKSNTNNNGKTEEATLIQGVPRTPTKKSGIVIPGPNKPWHDIYNYNVDASDIVNCRIDIPIKEIDQDHIYLIDDKDEEWELVENIATQMSVGKFFELRVDEYDNPYLYLINYWQNFEVKKFKLFYIQSSGEAGQIVEGALQNLVTPAYVILPPIENPKILNVQGYIMLNSDASSYGYNPETPDEAREESTKYVNTAKTLVTLDDFTRFVMRLDTVANCLATDLTNDPGIIKHLHYGDFNEDGIVDMLDRNILADYIDDPAQHPLTKQQYKIADFNQDGKVNRDDLEIMDKFLRGNYTTPEEIGKCGDETDVSVPLDLLTVKIYIARTDDHVNDAEPQQIEFIQQVQTALENTKHIALNIIPTVNEINYYYWTVKGEVYLKTPVTLDKANDILVRINQQLRFDNRPENTPFNEKVKFIDVVHSIEDKVDTLIDHVDLEPIEYFKSDGTVIDSRLVKGEFTQKVPINPTGTGSLEYKIKLENTPIRPNYLSISINGGDVILKDNGSGKIPNINGVLQGTGEVDYTTGEINLKLNVILTQPLEITYTKNSVNMSKYENLNTLTFKIAAECIKNN